MSQFSRREFAKTATVATVSTAISNFRMMGANDRVRLGLVALGNRGDQVLDAFLAHTDCEVTGICDIHQPYLARNFLDCVRSRKQTNCDIEAGHHSTSSRLLCNIAYKLKAYLEWDGKAEKFTNHAAANRLLSYQYRAPHKFPTNI